MSVSESLHKAKNGLHSAWLDGLNRSHIIMGQREAVQCELRPWLDLLGPAAEGDESSAHELYKLVALHARNLGSEGHPASAALMQVVLLEEILRDQFAEFTIVAGVVREMTRVVVDAHALGSSERIKNRHNLEIRDFSPVLHIGPRTVVGFLLGAMDRELIDAMMGRLLRESVRSGAHFILLDAFGAERDNDCFHRILLSFTRSEAVSQISLILTGLRDPDATRAALEALGCDMQRIHFKSDINTAVADTFLEIADR